MTTLLDTLVRYRELGTGRIGLAAAAAGDRFASASSWIEFDRSRAGDVVGARWSLAGGAGTFPARQEIQRAGTLLEAMGRPHEQVEAIRRFQEVSFRYSRTGEGREDYLNARRTGAEQDWLRYVWSPADPAPENFLRGRLNGGFNPLPSLLALDEPILALWGENDVNVLPEVHRSIFEVALDAAGNDEATLEIVRAPTTSSRSRSRATRPA